jgi:hypothetical protein
MGEMHWHDRLRVHAAWQNLLVGVGQLTAAWGHRTIVLLSSYRFGSSLMMNYLHAQPNIRRRGEILNPDEIVYGNFEGAPANRVLLHIKAMSFALPGRLTMAKLMDSQIEDHGLTLDDVIVALDRPYIVAVYRRDLLSAYVSLRIAQQNGIWYSTDRVNNERVSIELAALEKYVRATRLRWMRNTTKLRTYDRAIIVAYEDFADHPKRVMYEIFDFLKLPRRGPVTETVRQNPAPLHCKIENYRELGLEKLVARGELTLNLDPIPIPSGA